METNLLKDKRGGLFKYLFWIGIGFALGLIFYKKIFGC